MAMKIGQPSLSTVLSSNDMSSYTDHKIKP